MSWYAVKQTSQPLKWLERISRYIVLTTLAIQRIGLVVLTKFSVFTDNWLKHHKIT